MKQGEDQLHKKRSSESVPKKAATLNKCDQDLVLRGARAELRPQCARNVK
ncbi:hypothetical protein C3B79_2700 [Aeromonas hydrophila]|nr:hypothetical protein C3B79_2700 [Aeromonas hydrophila]